MTDAKPHEPKVTTPAKGTKDVATNGKTPTAAVPARAPLRAAPGSTSAGVAHVSASATLAATKLAVGVAGELVGSAWRIGGLVYRAALDSRPGPSRVGTAASPTPATPTTPELPSVDDANVFESPITGQVVNIVWNFSIAFSHFFARLFEVIAGPLESVMSPDPTLHQDQRLVIGPVVAGSKGSGAFSLANAAPNDAEVTVLLSNPPASTLGVIPIDRVVFTPRPATVPGSGSKQVSATVTVPSSTQPGRYLGIVRSDEVPDLTLILEILVASGDGLAVISD